MVDDTEEIIDESVETDTESTEEGNDLRATLEAAMRQQQETSQPEQPEDPAAEKRSRDERGRFASTKQVSDQAPQVEGKEASQEPIVPPYSWSGEQKELFSQLPRSLQEYVQRREQERESLVGRKAQEASAIRERYAPVDRIVEQYGDVFRRANLDPYQGLESLVQAQQYLDRDPVGALQLMAQSYGLDLSQIATGTPTVGTEQAYPQMHYLTSELQTIQSKLAALEQEKRAQQQRSAVGEVEAFANEIDNNGKLLRPYMADVHEQMMDEVRLIRARNPEMPARQILQEAYEISCWKNPSVRGRLIEQQQRPQMQAARVQQAKLAGSSVRGAPGASSLAVNSSGSIRDALMAAFEQHT